MIFCALPAVSPTTKLSWAMQSLSVMTRVKDNSNDYVIRVLATPRDADAGAWNALLADQASPSPFMRHEYLCSMHDSKSAVPATGWAPRFITLWRGDELHGAC